MLLKEGADPNQVDTRGKTALFVAAGNYHEEVVKMLLKEGADPNQVDTRGKTALFVAAGNYHEEVVKMLLKEGANPNHISECGGTALSYIIAFDNKVIPITKILLEAGTEPNYLDSTDKKYIFGTRTYLSIALQHACKDSVEMLLKAGADPNILNKHDSDASPLISAVLTYNPEIVEMILDAGADIYVIGCTGETALDVARSLLNRKGFYSKKTMQQCIKIFKLLSFVEKFDLAEQYCKSLSPLTKDDSEQNWDMNELLFGYESYFERNSKKQVGQFLGKQELFEILQIESEYLEKRAFKYFKEYWPVILGVASGFNINSADEVHNEAIASLGSKIKTIMNKDMKGIIASFLWKDFLHSVKLTAVQDGNAEVEQGVQNDAVDEAENEGQNEEATVKTPLELVMEIFPNNTNEVKTDVDLLADNEPALTGDGNQPVEE